MRHLVSIPKEEIGFEVQNPSSKLADTIALI